MRFLVLFLYCVLSNRINYVISQVLNEGFHYLSM